MSNSYDMPLLGFSNGGNKKTRTRKQEEKKNMQNSGLRLSDTVCTAPLAPMGVLALRLRTLDGPLVPPSTRAEIFRHACLQSNLQTSPPTPQKSYPNFRNTRTNFEIFKKFFYKT
jgi:hypothetical protein